MQLSTFVSVGFVALASLMPAYADHELRFRNNCGFNVTPKWKAGSGGLTSGANMSPGSTWSGWVPEYWVAGRVYGQNGACLEPDGVRCTLFECTFNNIGFNQCNISRVSGYNIGMSFSWIGGSGCQPGKSCDHANCPNTVAWLAPDSCNGCLSQCNTARVGMLVTFCPGGGGGGGGGCQQTHNVVSGDNCWALGQRYGVSSAQIISWNPSVNSGCTNLQVGQQLCVRR